MALSRGEINPLSVLGIRKLSFIPDHFTKITIDPGINKTSLSQWIEYNLNSRYAIVSKLSLDSNNKVVMLTEIGLEDSKEMSLLTLGCRLLHKK